MLFYQNILSQLLLCLEILSAIVAIGYLNKVKKTYWKWFVLYLIFVSLSEIFGKFSLDYFQDIKKYYYDFFVIPIEFLFFYWIYAIKSLKKQKLFWTSCIIYFISFIPHVFYIKEMRLINSMSYTVGCLLLLVFVLLEFYKQIKSDDIMFFKQNKMFYINLGVILFYVGTLPFFALDKFLLENARTLYLNYFTFFLIANCIMYILFTASFIWGKPKT